MASALDLAIEKYEDAERNHHNALQIYAARIAMHVVIGDGFAEICDRLWAAEEALSTALTALQKELAKTEDQLLRGSLVLSESNIEKNG